MSYDDIVNNIHIKNIENILLSIGERVEGNLICDVTPNCYIINENIDKIRNLQHLVKNKKYICEIGVNACHSLILMLLINPFAEYLLFDLNFHRYTDPCINYIKQAFPQTKITAIYGNSIETVTKYSNENNTIFDFVHIDGGHTHDVFSNDYENVKKMSNNDSLIAFDDYDYPDIFNFINEKVNQLEIIDAKDDNIIKNKHQFIYSYNKK